MAARHVSEGDRASEARGALARHTQPAYTDTECRCSCVADTLLLFIHLSHARGAAPVAPTRSSRLFGSRPRCFQPRSSTSWYVQHLTYFLDRRRFFLFSRLPTRTTKLGVVTVLSGR